MAASNRVYMPTAIREAFEFAAEATSVPLHVVQEKAIRGYLKSRRVTYDFKVIRKKRGPKPKVAA